MHLHRVTRDIETDRSSHAVGVPRLHGAIRCARTDETVYVRAVSVVLTSAVARHILQNARVLSGEHVGLLHELGRTSHLRHVG